MEELWPFETLLTARPTTKNYTPAWKLQQYRWENLKSLFVGNSSFHAGLAGVSGFPGRDAVFQVWRFAAFVNLLGSKIYFMYYQLAHSQILRSAHKAFMCFVWIWEQTAIISLYSNNLSVFITKAVFTARYGLGL
jgi:hypothetical protein